MGIFQRIRDNLRQQLNQVVDGVEQRNVAAVYESAIENAIQHLAEHKSRIAGLVVMRDRTTDEVTALETELKQVVAGVQGSVAEGDDDTALVLLARKEELTTELSDKARLLTDLADQVEGATAGQKELREGVQALKREKETAVANHALAEAQIDIDEATTGLSDQAHIRGLDSVRESIGRLERQANPGYIDSEGKSVRGRAEAMGRKAAEASAREQLEALKEAMRADAESEDDPA